MKLEGKSFRLFIDAQKSEATKEIYTFFLKKYMEWRHIRGKNTDILLKDKDIQGSLIEYISYLKGKGLRHSTRGAYLAGVLAFYDLNDIVLNSKKINRYLGQSQRPLENRAYSREEISKILEYTDERSRAVVLILVSCGCRINALPKLIMNDLKIVEEYQQYRITLYGDSNESYYSYLTPEATKALQSYLHFREVAGEKITPKSPVFRREFHREREVHNPKPLTSRGFEEIVNDLLIRSGLRKIKHKIEGGKARHEIKLTSGFRKFYDTMLEAASVRPLIKELLMGHSIGLDKHYLKPTENEVLQEYNKAIPFLTISQEEKYKVENIQLLAKNEYMDKAVGVIDTRLKQKDDQIQELRDMMRLIFEKQEREDKALQQFGEDSDKYLGTLKASDKLKKFYLQESKKNREINKRIEEASAAILKDSKKKKK